MSEEQPDYSNMEDPTIRATVLAHAIRTNGTVPPVGMCVGFSLQMKEIEAMGLADAIARVAEAENKSGKYWFSFEITAEDLAGAREMIRNPEFTGHPGKTSSLPIDPAKLRL